MSTKDKILDLAKKETPVAKKKGRPSWKPAQWLDVPGKAESHGYRWVDKDPMNVQRKVSEGWVFVNRETGVPGEQLSPEDVGDGKPLDSTKVYREMVLMAMPKDVIKERDAYFNEQTEGHVRSLKENLKSEIQREDEHTADIYGNITIIN
jgi:hypothetical protein|tara:strand:- start:422 stop:871 length:450 start_codon:yes stop_codon:yes gene_type:complete